MGRSRSEVKPSPISITKLQQLREEPQSPKIVKRAKVWGAKVTSPERRVDAKYFSSGRDALSADVIRERIDRKLAKMFFASDHQGYLRSSVSL
jgi:hypothetical protein